MGRSGHRRSQGRSLLEASNIVHNLNRPLSLIIMQIPCNLMPVPPSQSAPAPIMLLPPVCCSQEYVLIKRHTVSKSSLSGQKTSVVHVFLFIFCMACFFFARYDFPSSHGCPAPWTKQTGRARTQLDDVSNKAHHHKPDSDGLRYLDELALVGCVRIVSPAKHSLDVSARTQRGQGTYV